VINARVILEQQAVRLKIKALIPQLLTAAQDVYDKFDQKDDVSFGICADVANATVNVLKNSGFKNADVDYTMDQEGLTHVRAVVEPFTIDIPWYHYEDSMGHDQIFVVRGGITFTPNMVEIKRLR
jgi:hypothetical protein